MVQICKFLFFLQHFSMVYYMMMIILGVNTDTFYIFHHIDPRTYIQDMKEMLI